MEYITSRGFELPTDQHKMENFDWFNMWSNKNFPYHELLLGDTLYWFDTTAQKLVWKTEVVKVDRFPYSDKQEIFDRYPNSLGLKYYDSRPDSGYFVGYKIKVIEKINRDKPTGFRFPQLGWLRVDNEISQKWFNRNPIEDINILDDNISADDKTISEQLAFLNLKMQNVSPERIDKLVSMTIRKDTKIINALKKSADFKCQFPDCGQQIKKKGGGFYVEVAHVKSVSTGGQSVLGNLIVLCPNHHKEFDYGELSISEQTTDNLSGLLNGRQFEIKLTR
ncbi:MAG: HNH endonuclease [Chitinophagaceae bacterium]|nr:HNH endonuclease [Chitinophagaceae bacterium]